MGDALLSVVGPIFLFQLAPKIPLINQVFPDDIRTGFFFVISFFLAERIAVLLLAPLVARLPISKNIRLALTVGQGLIFLIVVLYTFVEAHLWILALLPILRALNLLWFWTSYYVLLASELDLEKVGREMGSLEVLSKIATLLGPLVGVLLVPFISFNGVFWIGSLFFFLSVLSLLWLPTLHIRTVWKWSDFGEALQTSAGRKQMIGLGGTVWEEVAMIIFWPLFLYIFFQKNMVSAGYILTGATFTSFIFIYLSGWIFDHRKRKSHWELGSGGILAGLWLLRGLAFQFPLFTIVTEIIDKVAGGVYFTLFTSLVILRIRANNAIVYAYNREIAFAFAQIVGSISLYLVLFLNLHISWMFVSFFVGGALGLLFVKNRQLRYRLDT
jgi:MFS family permease